MIIFTCSSPEVDRPDLEITLSPFTATKSIDIKKLDKTPGVFMSCVPLRPRSRGQTQIRSADIRDHPAIAPNYLHDEADQQVSVNHRCATAVIFKDPGYWDVSVPRS